MSEFTPIETQEELDRIIGQRLEREKESTAKKYGDYDDLKKQNKEYQKQVSDLSAELKKYEEGSAETSSQISELEAKVKMYETDSVKTRIALEAGLPYGMARRLAGETEDEIREDAKSLVNLIGSQQVNTPEQNDDLSKKGESSDKLAYRELLTKIK